MRPLPRGLLALALLSLACEPNDPSSEGPPCPPPTESSPTTYTVSFAGFPEIAGDTLVDPDLEFDFTSTCTITQLSFLAVDELELVLACEHPDSSDASVTITTAASDVPGGLSVDASVEFHAYAFFNQGGDRSGGVFRALSNANLEIYEISDESGLVFAAVLGDLGGSFGSISVEPKWNCPGWSPCSGEGDISGYIQASSGDTSVDVHIGEVVQLVDGGLAWDLSLFQARLGDCHGYQGGFSIVRRPG